MSNQHNQDPTGGHVWIGILHNLYGLFEASNQFKHAWHAYKDGRMFMQCLHLLLGGAMLYVCAVVLLFLSITAFLAPIVAFCGSIIIIIAAFEFVGLCIIRTFQYLSK